MRCFWMKPLLFPARPPLVLVSYLFHKQKKISKLGWAAIWQSVCLKLIFNTRKIFDMYRQCHASWHSYSLECYSYWFALSLLHSIFSPQSKCWQKYKGQENISINTQNNKINSDNSGFRISDFSSWWSVTAPSRLTQLSWTQDPKVRDGIHRRRNMTYVLQMK